jgi:hypothetical protein
MSRSPINWDKGRRRQHAREAALSAAVDQAQSEEPSASLLEFNQGEKLKPHIVQHLRSQKPVSAAVQCAIKLVRSSRLRIFARENFEDDVTRFECEMQVRYQYSHLDAVDLITSLFSGASEVRGANWNLLFWFQCPRSVMNE